MRPGQYDDHGHKSLYQQLEDLYPEFDEFGEPYVPEMWEPITRLHESTPVFGVTAACVPASADAWPPDTPNSNPSSRGSLAASTSSHLHPPA